MSTETVIDLNDLRTRVLAGAALDDETARRVIEQLRAARRSASESAAASKKKKASSKKVLSDEGLDDTLKSLGLDI